MIYLPTPPTADEKYRYFEHQKRWPFFWLFFGQVCLLYGFVNVAYTGSNTTLMCAFLIVMLPPCVVNFWLRIRRHRLSLDDHQSLIEEWASDRIEYPSVDVFLPSCGETAAVLHNTFTHVGALRWDGDLTVYVLDDAASAETARLADEFGYRYVVRPNRGELKKAGNLIHAYEHSSGEFMAVFDADFAPCPEFLLETVPYMDESAVGVVQTAQYFDIDQKMNYIQRFSGSLQELFFRWIQPARDTCEAAICAGTNVVYRREAVDAVGGFARVPIGEDVHSGVKLWTADYRTRNVQVCLAKGLAPDSFEAVTNQQYRWCRSSMLLMISSTFRSANFSVKQRVCFWAAFLYYISSASLLFTSVLPTLIMVRYFPDRVSPRNYLPIVPALLSTFIVFPRLARGWRYDIYRLCMINSVCHLLAVFHAVRGKVEAWVPTGAVAAIGATRKKTNVPRRVGHLLRGWIVLVELGLWTGIARDLSHGYKLTAFWPAILLGVVQFAMLAPFLLPRGLSVAPYSSSDPAHTVDRVGASNEKARLQPGSLGAEALILSATQTAVRSDSVA